MRECGESFRDPCAIESNGEARVLARAILVEGPRAPSGSTATLLVVTTAFVHGHCGLRATLPNRSWNAAESNSSATSQKRSTTKMFRSERPFTPDSSDCETDIDRYLVIVAITSYLAIVDRAVRFRRFHLSL